VSTSPPTPVSGSGEPTEDGKGTSAVRNTVEWVVIIVGALLLALLVKTFLFQVFLIPSASMFPTLQNKDRVVVNKLSYEFGEINRGDLVVFGRPTDSLPNDIDHLIKRVVAHEGETVSAENGRVLIDGRPLDEPYLSDSVITGDMEPVVVPEDKLWVMGDNREFSEDSRVFGPIDEDLVVGRAFVKLWPLGDIGLL
jgi:signal peptidase I